MCCFRLNTVFLIGFVVKSYLLNKSMKVVRKILVKIYGPVSNHCLNAGNLIFYMKSHWKHVFIGHRRGWCQWRQQRGALVFFVISNISRDLFLINLLHLKRKGLGIDFLNRQWAWLVRVDWVLATYTKIISNYFSKQIVLENNL